MEKYVLRWGAQITLALTLVITLLVSPSFALDSFRFLPPLAPGWGDPDKFDASLLNYLLVEVCEVNGSSCPVIKTFTAQGAGSEQLRIETNGKDGTYYIANWDTTKFAFNRKTYRVRGILGDLQLGAIDLSPDIYNTFGRTWPIKFSIEADPVLRVRLLRSLGKSAWQIASVLRNEFNLSPEEVAALLANDLVPFSAEEIDQALNGVYQPAVIPATTRISDEETRTALISFDPPTGRMTFAYETPLLKSLQQDDVMVSEPGAAAPYGYLRKVTAIKKVKGLLVIESIQASLNEAIQQGTLDASGTLQATGSSTLEVLAPGVIFRSLSLAPGASQTAGLVADGYNYEVSIDQTFDGAVHEDGVDGTGTVHIQGSIRFNAGYDIGLGVETCAEIPPVCVDRFEARLGVDQYSNIRVTGNFEGTFDKERVLATKIFDPITVFIGPFPVVLVPVVDVIVGVKGDAHLSFSFAAELAEQLTVGAKWTDPDDGGIGWEDVSKLGLPQGRVLDQNLDADMWLVAFGKADAKLLVYGIAGPGFASRVGTGVDVMTGRKPLWRIFGYSGADVNFQVDLAGILKLAEYKESLLDQDFTLAESADQPPRCSAVGTVIRANITVPITLGPNGGGFFGYFDCVDPEGEPITYKANSDKDGSIPLRVRFTDEGERVITVTATDSSNNSSTFTLNVLVVNTPPIVTVATASTSVPVTVQYFITASAYDWETQTFLPCSSMTWSVTPPDILTVSSDNRSCTAVVVFPQEGLRPVTVTATDMQGGSSSRTVAVDVTGPPTNPAPVIDLNSFLILAAQGPRDASYCITGVSCEAPYGAVLFNGLVGEYYPPLTMSLSASDPESEPITVQWFCETGTVQAPVTDNGDGTFSCSPAYSSESPIVVRAVVSDGVTEVNSEVRHFLMLLGVN